MYPSKSSYRTLVQNPPKLNLLVGSKEFKLELISCMCDNRSTLTASIDESVVDGKVIRHGISLRYTFGCSLSTTMMILNGLLKKLLSMATPLHLTML